MDDGAFLFLSREELQRGAKLIFSHFRRFGLKMHIGTDGSFSDSKTEAVVFPAPGQILSSFDTSPVYINDTGYVTYTDKFKYLGSYITHDLSDTFDVKNRVTQATKAMGAMMPNIFRSPHLSLYVKKLLYMAIPMNLLLWGSETWALKQSDWKKLQVFHTSAIQCILNINMMEVQLYRISNEEIYKEFGIDPLENILVSRQLKWIGKIALMPENRLPRKFLAAWHFHPRPTGRPQTTIRHSYIHALRFAGVLPEEEKNGKLADWLPQIADDPKEWERFRRSLTPNLTGRQNRERGVGQTSGIGYR